MVLVVDGHILPGPHIFCEEEKITMKKFLALLLAMMMVLSLAACGEKEDAPAQEPTGQEETQTPEAPAEGGTVGVCIYKFDDAFMTTYRNALQEILEGKGYTVTVVDGNNDQAK